MSENAGRGSKARYRPTRRGRHRSLPTDDRLVCATAAHHGLVVLRGDCDNDFAAAAGLSADVDEHSVHRTTN
ncbi:hypothetical protein [Streptomyces sp. AcE210]|uniref:hypothetical protein n=1 Tax=Streptomyces sp. AcE210 TaxID=2292703 RepID=UPI000E307D5F|nr:hypothetical protein [Streptomyces sp. AcE210]RFC74022.1 hypothetical protein DXZ75_45980 [Streptomyces sp. AcE210]